MRKLFLAILLSAAANICLPAWALSPAECSQLLVQIRDAKKRTVTGGYNRTDPEYLAARRAEDEARDEMVRTGCNKKANAGTPMCQAIIARVTEAAANRKVQESDMLQVRQASAAVREAELTARYELECRQAQTPTPPARKRVERKLIYDPSATEIAVGTAMIFGILGTRSPRGPSGPSGPTSRHHPRR